MIVFLLAATYMWVPLDNTSRTCEQQYCLEVCAKTATPLPEGVSVMKLTDEQLVCMLCEPGTQRNVTGQGELGLHAHRSECM